MHPIVSPFSQAMYCFEVLGSAMFPVKSVPRLGHKSGQFVGLANVSEKK